MLRAVDQVSAGCIMHLPGQGLSHPLQTGGERVVTILKWVEGTRQLGFGAWTVNNYSIATLLIR